jgi:hypothetical protein
LKYFIKLLEKLYIHVVSLPHLKVKGSLFIINMK